MENSAHENATVEISLHDGGAAPLGRNKPSASFTSVDMDLESDPEIRPLVTFREKLSALLHSTKFQIAIVVLVIVDCLLVVTELLVEVEILKLHEHSEAVPQVIHYMSISILSLFLVEIVAKLYAYRLRFFKHKMEMFDAVVVVVSFALDVAFRNPDSAANAGGLIIVLRLWRVARLLNGIVLTVKTQAEHRLAREVKLREKVLQDLLRNRDYCNALEQEIASLREILESHGIHDLPPTVVEVDELKESTVQKNSMQVR